MHLHLDVGQLFCPTPHLGVPRLEELLIHAARNLWTVLHTQVVAKQNDIDVRPDGAKKPFQVGEVNFGQPVKELVRPSGIARQEHQKSVHPVEPLADLQQVAAKQTDDRTIGVFAEVFGSVGQHPLAVGAPDQRAGRRGHAAPHIFA